MTIFVSPKASRRCAPDRILEASFASKRCIPDIMEIHVKHPISRHALLAVPLAFVLLAGCAGFKIGKDGFGFELAAATIQSEIDKKAGFPIEQDAGGVAEVALSAATLQLWPDENAIGLRLPVKVKIPFTKWHGAASISTVPEYVPAEGAIYVTHLKLRRIEVDGLPAPIESAVATAVTKILDMTIQRYKVYELDKEKFGEHMASLVLKDVKVHPEGVFFRLGF